MANQKFLAIHVAGVSDNTRSPSGINNNEGNLYMTGDPYQSYGLSSGNDSDYHEFDLPSFYTESDYRGTTTTVFNVYPNRLVDVSGLNTEIEPYFSEIKFGRFEFTLDATDETTSDFRSTPRLSDSELDSDLQRSDGKISIKNYDAGNVGDLVYVGHETILLDSHDSGNTFNVLRGMFLSRRGSFNEGTNVFQSPPFWNRRPVRLFEVDITTDPITMKQKFMGYIDGSPEHDKAQIQISCNELLSNIFRAVVNKNPVSGQSGDEINSLRRFERGNDSLEFKFNIETSRVFKETEYGNNPIGIVQMNETPVMHFDGFLDRSLAPRSDYFISRAPYDSFVGDEQIVTSPDFDSSDIHEFFLIDRKLDLNQRDQFGTTRTINATDYDLRFSATRALEESYSEYYIYHPLAIVASLLFSTASNNTNPYRFDVLHDNYSLNLDHMISDAAIDNIHDLIQSTSELQVDYLALGWNAETEEIWNTILGLLQTFNFQMLVDEQGRIKFDRIGVADVYHADEAESNKITVEPGDVLHVDDGFDAKVDHLAAEIGDLPWADSRTREVISTDTAALGNNMPRKPDSTINMESLSPTNQQSINRLETKVRKTGFQTPRLDVRAQNEDAIDFSMGSSVSFEIPTLKDWLVDQSGSRVSFSTGDLKTMGKIISKEYLPFEDAFQLRLFLYSMRGRVARLRAPSGIIDGADPVAQTITFKSGFNSNLRPDFEAFSVGDEVQIFNRDGSQKESTIQEVTNKVASDTIEFDNWNWNEIPQEGEVVALAYYDTDDSGDGYSNSPADTVNLSNIDRAWALLAETDKTVGDAEGDADIYGGGN